MVTRTDATATLEQRADGTYRARTSRTGIQVYDGVREYRPLEEVFSEDSLKTLIAAPVQVGHEPRVGKVVGRVEGNVLDRVEVDGESYVGATLLIQDEHTRERINKRQLGGI